jgi:hypothetical protein
MRVCVQRTNSLGRHLGILEPGTSPGRFLIAVILVLAFYLMAIYSLIYGDAFILREGIPFASMDW